jgi:Fe-S cluster biogenesis protein NfuA
LEKDIVIIAEPTTNPAACKFNLDRPVYPGGSAYLGNREAARFSPLAQRLFEIPEVENLLIAENQITVTKTGQDPWPVIGKQVGAKIREHMRSGQPAVSEEFARSLPPESEIRKRIQQLLDTEINPAVGMHGGWVELIDVKKNSVYIRMGGGCQGCGAADVTLKMGIEKSIRGLVPQVGEILDTTDHAAGRNPYYQPSK